MSKKNEDLSLGGFLALNEEYLCQLLDLFPIPIHLFRGYGMSIFVNRAFREQSGLHDISVMVGKFNLLTDPYHNKVLNFSKYIQTVFSGVPIVIEDFRVPLDYMTDFFKISREKLPEETMYLRPTAFPIPDSKGGVAYVVFMFEVKKRYVFGQNIAAAKEAIESQVMGKLNIDTAAKACNMSKANLTRLFKKHLGQTPHGYWLDLKIDRLKEELQNPNVSVSEAFAACDLDYNSHYTRLFKKKTGLTPLEYKNSELQRVR